MDMHAYINVSCIKCHTVEKNMVRVGAFVMCAECSVVEFQSLNPQSEEREKYKYWLDKYMKG